MGSKAPKVNVETTSGSRRCQFLSHVSRVRLVFTDKSRGGKGGASTQLKSQVVSKIFAVTTGTTSRMLVLYSIATACDNSCTAANCSFGILSDVVKWRGATRNLKSTYPSSLKSAKYTQQLRHRKPFASNLFICRPSAQPLLRLCSGSRSRPPQDWNVCQSLTTKRSRFKVTQSFG